MSKIETKGKSVNAGEVPAQSAPVTEGEESSSIDTFESKGASKFKAMGLSTSSPLDGMTDATAWFSDSLNATIKSGMFGTANRNNYPVTQFNLRISKLGKDEYTKKFEKIELPPSSAEISALMPATGESDVKSSINEAVGHYLDFIDLCEERKQNALKAIGGNQVSADDSDILKQFVKELEDAQEYAREQKDAVENYKGGK